MGDEYPHGDLLEEFLPGDLELQSRVCKLDRDALLLGHQIDRKRRCCGVELALGLELRRVRRLRGRCRLGSFYDDVVMGHADVALLQLLREIRNLGDQLIIRLLVELLALVERQGMADLLRWAC